MLRAENIYKCFGALQVTRDVSLKIPIGIRHAIIGPNGAGKTTLFNLLAGELTPDAGRILIDGQDVTAYAPDRRARRGLSRSFQKNSLFLNGTVRENLMLADIVTQRYGFHFWSRLSDNRRARDKTSAVAEQVGLADLLERGVSELSYGAQRQLEVGLALMGTPKVLLLDEPTSGMSPEETGRMLQLIDELPRDMAVLLIEHDMDLVFSHADRITVLNYGEILMEGTPQQVRGSDIVHETYLGGKAAH
jgi:ABC-type branched-subunit amino acid transport system ATPase component